MNATQERPERKELLTQAEAAKYLRVCRQTLRRLVTGRRIKPTAITKGRKGKRYRRDELDAYIEKVTREQR